MTHISIPAAVYRAFTAFLLFSTVGCINRTSTADHASADSSAKVPAAVSTKNILFFGDSLTAGYGLEDPADDAYPAVIRRRIDSLDLRYQVINAGLSGETSAGGLGRIDWVLRQPVSVFVLALGANDGLRGIPPEETLKNLEGIIRKVRAKYPRAKILLAGMQVPPSMGPDYAASFKEVFPTLAREEHLALVPFLLEGVGGNPRLNQADGIHPTAAGARVVAHNVWQVLKKLL